MNYQVIIKDINRAIDDGRLRLPSFPENLVKIREALNNPNTSMKTLAQLVHADAALANRIYALANSSAYALDTGKLSLLNIMTMLGLNLIRTTIYNYCLSQLFADRRFKRIDQVASFVRNRSLEIAGLNYAISKRYRIDDSNLALLAGLFHNVGALVIMSWLVQNPSAALDVKQQKSLVISGQYQFSKRVMAEWKVPESLKRVVEAGETSLDTHDDNNRFAHLVEVSRWMSRVLRNTRANDEPPVSSIALFGLSVEQLLADKEAILSEMIRVIQTIR
jgi:HD-like signal output (HDOD) protein